VSSCAYIQGGPPLTHSSPLISITQSHHDSHSPRIALPHSQHSYYNPVPGSSVYPRAPLTIPELEWTINLSRQHYSDVKQRQTTSVKDTKKSEAAEEEREAADDKELLPWARARLTHLYNY
jgi:hypothetical protein